MLEGASFWYRQYHLRVLSGEEQGVASHSIGPVSAQSLHRGSRNLVGSGKKDIVLTPHISIHNHLSKVVGYPELTKSKDSIWFTFSGLMMLVYQKALL
jgi:hypothetical protein